MKARYPQEDPTVSRVLLFLCCCTKESGGPIKRKKKKELRKEPLWAAVKRRLNTFIYLFFYGGTLMGRANNKELLLD